MGVLLLRVIYTTEALQFNVERYIMGRWDDGIAYLVAPLLPSYCSTIHLTFLYILLGSVEFHF